MADPDYKDAARRLWMLLDDIDTLDDACRADDAAFRKHAREVQRKRFGVLSGEQMDVLLAAGVKVRAPWSDFGGNPIHDGDTIRHPSGEVGRVVYRPEGATEHDRWKVDYENGSPLSSLSLQVGGKGMAVVFPLGVGVPHTAKENDHD
jgi:hypothetical protein